MRRLLCVAVAAVGLGTSVPAAAANWVEIARSDDGGIEYYDPATVTRNGQNIQYRTRSDYRDADVDPDFPEISETLEEMDCAGNRLRPIEIIDYDALERETDRYDFRDDIQWIAIDAGSVAAAKRDKICR